jgi:hypothetical protein
MVFDEKWRIGLRKSLLIDRRFVIVSLAEKLLGCIPSLNNEGNRDHR